MKFEEVKKIIPMHRWWSEECPGKWQYCYWMYSWVEQRAYFHPKYLSVALFTVKEGYIQEKTSEQEKIEIYYWLKTKYQADYSYLDQEYDKWTAVRTDLYQSMKDIAEKLEALSQTELLELYNRFLSLAIDSVRWGVFIESVDPYGEQVLTEQLKRALPEIDDASRNDLLITLSTPLIVSFMEEFQIDKARAVIGNYSQLMELQSFNDLQRLSKKNSSMLKLNKMIDSLTEQYCWISVNYNGSPPLTQRDVYEQLKEECSAYSVEQLVSTIKDAESKIDCIEEKQSEYLKKYQLPQDMLDDFSILRIAGRWVDERKESMVRTSFYLRMLLGAISKKISVPQEELEWYLREEVNELIKTGNTVPHSTLNKRSSNAVFLTEYNGNSGSILSIFSGNESSELYRAVNSVEHSILKGIVAARPNENLTEHSGIVQIVLDMEKDYFKDGNILVTSMTRPEFLPIMKKASAIITDEGGVTSHAAIISRELGIPCIIGTKYATKLLQNGDEVIINLQSGEIIKK